MVKSKLSRATAVATAAIALSALASPTVAKTYTYTFGAASDGAYCDGITFTDGGSGDICSGNLLGRCGSNNGVGGFTIKGPCLADMKRGGHATPPRLPTPS